MFICMLKTVVWVVWCYQVSLWHGMIVVIGQGDNMVDTAQVWAIEQPATIHQGQVVGVSHNAYTAKKNKNGGLIWYERFIEFLVIVPDSTLHVWQ